ncbi:hypothetical protein JTE90_015174 [Oedothorax gibbosus]|uniref:Uncharacterized protein n=1 Tax=Oedothorax gibbosus TaxID=931172 RepID=A0AAV6V760_9ARAC|nr:hypothetical protein JTE90_015174 [Oedothorax gibbosus]
MENIYFNLMQGNPLYISSYSSEGKSSELEFHQNLCHSIIFIKDKAPSFLPKDKTPTPITLGQSTSSTAYKKKSNLSRSSSNPVLGSNNLGGTANPAITQGRQLDMGVGQCVISSRVAMASVGITAGLSFHVKDGWLSPCGTRVMAWDTKSELRILWANVEFKVKVCSSLVEN